MRIGAERRARRVRFLKAGDGVFVVAIEDGEDIERPATHLVLAVGKGCGRLCCGEKRKSLIVEIEGRIDQLAGLVGEVAVKAVIEAIDLFEPAQPMLQRILPRTLPAVLAGGSETIGLTGLHAGAAVIRKNRFRILAEALVKTAVRTGGAHLPPQR